MSGPSNFEGLAKMIKEPPRWFLGLSRAACRQGRLTLAFTLSPGQAPGTPGFLGPPHPCLLLLESAAVFPFLAPVRLLLLLLLCSH